MQSFPEYEINQTEVMCPRRERVRFNELRYTCNNVNGKSFFNPFIHRNDGRKQTERVQQIYTNYEYYSFTAFVQSISSCGEIQNTRHIPYKVLNDFYRATWNADTI